ncbi:LLM class flavin-dependent oxidoreductase [Sphingomonas sp.]|uniref:LLM class flavin-dependent oxidoreductase n=1 Tax=Sphingomonas sp. TaxID=28214 RepID=UPI003AFFBEAA
MRVGLGMIFQNLGKERTDLEVYKSELDLADLAEPLGFDSIWATEHHFTDYMLLPSPVQFLTYMAGRTRHVNLGTMVIVVPWHNPLRAAEDVLMLDNLCGGRQIVSVGRGIAPVEFAAFDIPLPETRPLFVESAECVLEALETGVCEYDGQYVKQPRAPLRPGPFKSFRGRTYASGVSPASMPLLAKLGVGMLIVPQKPWPAIEKDLSVYREFYQQENDCPAPAPIVVGWTFVDEDPDRAESMARKYIGRYYDSTVDHYEFSNAELHKVPGYEYYQGISKKIAEVGREKFINYLVDLQVFGTPAQCLEKIEMIRARTGMETYVAVLSYGGMPAEEAERNLRLFSSKVMTTLQHDKVEVAA